MEISQYCIKCKGQSSTECNGKGYVQDMQDIKPDCFNESNKIGICINNDSSFKNVLTIGKEYEIIKIHNTRVIGYQLVTIIDDTGHKNTYYASRFDIR